VAVFGHDDVLGFEVPVDDPGAMGGLQRGSELGAQDERPVERQRAAGKSIAQCLALQILLHHEVHAVFMPNVVNRCDMRMVQRRCRTCLLLEPSQAFRIAGVVLGQHLDRHLPTQARVLRQPHLPHAARAELLEDFVRAKPSSAFHPREGSRRWYLLPIDTTNRCQGRADSFPGRLQYVSTTGGHSRRLEEAAGGAKCRVLGWRWRRQSGAAAHSGRETTSRQQPHQLHREASSCHQCNL